MDLPGQIEHPDAASSPIPTPSGSAAPAPGSSKKRRTAYDKILSNFEVLYPRGKVFVFPKCFKPQREFGELTRDEMPRDPKEYVPETSSAESKGDLTRRMKFAHKADKDHLRKNESHTKGYHAEYNVSRLVLSQLQEKTSPEDLPDFILHNLKLRGERDILVLSRKFGAVFVEVKGVDNTHVLKKNVEKGERQLQAAREEAGKKLTGLVKPESFTTVLALPNMSKESSKDIREHLKEQKIELLVGQEARDYQELLKGLGSRADSDVWDTSEPDVDSADTAFKKAASEFLSVPNINDQNTALLQVAGAHNRWLLTEEQMDIRDDPAKFLHIWGPPGSGKTLLLLQHTTRRLEEDMIVIVASGSWRYDLLQSHMGRAVLRNKGEGVKVNLHICRRHEDLERKLQEMRGKHPPEKICLVTDELHDVDVFRTIAEAVTNKRVKESWSADIRDLQELDPDLYEKANTQDWVSKPLKESIRCPREIIELLNRLCPDSPVQACRIPRPTFLGDGVKVVDHALHVAPEKPCLETEMKCEKCEKELTQALGKINDLGQWVVLGTGESVYDGLRDLASRLEDMKIHAVCEGSSDFLREAGVIVDDEQPSSENDERARKHRELVAAGLDSEGERAIHVVWGKYFQGLEKPGVVMVHWDEEDFHPDYQTEARRCDNHRREWFQAASRCQGRLVVWLLSPSPARSLLEPPPVQVPPDPPAPSPTATEGPLDTGGAASTSSPSPTPMSFEEEEDQG